MQHSPGPCPICRKYTVGMGRGRAWGRCGGAATIGQGWGGGKRRIYRMFAKGSNCVGYAKLGRARGFARRQTGQDIEAGRARGCIVSQTVFVLEDDADILRLVQFHLEAAGYTVRTYMAMGQIVADAERQPPALFLLDIMVPGGDGLDLCRRLRKNTALSTVPIIFLTARAAEDDRVMGLELGADDYITKPFGTRELVARVKAVLRRFERPTAPSM